MHFNIIMTCLTIIKSDLSKFYSNVIFMLENGDSIKKISQKLEFREYIVENISFQLDFSRKKNLESHSSKLTANN